MKYKCNLVSSGKFENGQYSFFQQWKVICNGANFVNRIIMILNSLVPDRPKKMWIVKNAHTIGGQFKAIKFGETL